MSNSIRCKFKCVSKTEFEYGYHDVVFRPVMAGDGQGQSPENKRFWEATPNGEIKLGVLKKPVADQYTVGAFYYFDSTPAEG